MEGLFLVAGAVTHEPAIDAWLEEQAPDLSAIARRWFERMRSCGTDVRELIHDGCPVACVGEAPFGYVNVFKAHVNIGFYRGADLPDPARILQGTGRRMRHAKAMPGTRLNAEALGAVIDAAYADIQFRTAVSR